MDDPSRELRLRQVTALIFRHLKNYTSVEMALVVDEITQSCTPSIAGASAELILSEWLNRGWVSVSPDGSHIRLTEAGKEQIAQWDEEDRLWHAGQVGELPEGKRLKAGFPATNLQKIAQIIGSETLLCLHDPYPAGKTLIALQKLGISGVRISNQFRFLTAPLSQKQQSERQAINSMLNDINAERGSKWEIRSYTGVAKPHRRFLMVDGGSVITCGLSLNNINKDEVLERIPGGSQYAVLDVNFFNNHWSNSNPF
jgi:hypothetical protein